MPEPNRGNQPNDAFLFHGEYSPLLHSQQAASDAVAWMRKEHPEFYKNGMGANWLSGDAKNNAIEAGHAYRNSLSEEARSTFDSKWQTIMGEHTGASEVGAVSELGRMGARRAAYERKIADAQVELAKQEPSIQRAEEVTPHPVDVDFPAHPSDLETDPFDQGAGQYNQSRRQAAAQATPSVCRRVKAAVQTASPAIGAVALRHLQTQRFRALAKIVHSNLVASWTSKMTNSCASGLNLPA